MASFIGIRSLINLNEAFEKTQKRLRLDRTARKAAFFRALGASFYLLAVTLALPASAQIADTDASAVAASASTANLVRWTGSLPQAAGRTVEISFSMYQNPAGGPALWSETQPVKVGTDGRYSVLLGTTSAEGLSQTLFQAGEARWIEARSIQAQPNTTSGGDAVLETANTTLSARSLLAAVPYAFKSADADTLAGRAATDYVTREDLQSTVANQVQAISSTRTLLSNAVNPLPIVGTPLPIQGYPSSSSSGGGTALNGAGISGFLPAWTASATLGNSMIAESGTNVGIGTSAPATMLDVNGASTLRGTVGLLAATATLAAGVNSPALQLGASAYSSASNAAVPQNFVWQAASAGNNTANPSANLALLFGAGTMPPAETGLSIDPSGVITFAPGQTFPFADSGSGGGGTSSTITAVTAGSGLTGGGSAGNVTIALAGPISTANGGTGASTPAGALASMGFGGTFYANNYNSFSAALSAASGGTLVITSLVSITTSTTIPSNVAISVAQGGGISVNSGQTLKINGRFQAGLYQVFTGSGTVSFGPNTITDAYAGWWYGGSGAWDFSINSCIAAASAIATWCDLPATVNTINTITVPSNTWLRPVSQNGAGYFFGLGYGTVWTHSPTISGAATISTVGGSTITYSTRIEGILFASTNSGGHYPEAAIYLSYDIGCRLKGIGSSSTYTLATILVSALMNCKMDELGINGILSSPNPAGLRFLGDKSTPIGSISTTVDITHLSMDGGDVAGVVFDGDACLGCNFYSPSIETLAQNAFNIGKGNQVDLYSPYVENVPRTDSAFGIFRIGQDYSTALGGTSVNIFGGNVAGTNITNPVNPLAFDLGPYMGSVALHGGTYWQINNFQNISSACTNCVLHINNVSAYATMGFGTVTAANSNQIDFPAGNVFGCAAYYINGADCGPAVSQQFGLAVNAPGYPRVSPGQLFYSTDKGLLVWNNSLPTPAWQSAAQGLNSVLSSASPNLNPPEALSPAGAHASAAISAPELTVHNKCFSTASPAVCGISASGTVQIAANARKLVVYTSNVAADSVILYSYQIAASGCTTAPTNIASLLAPYTSAVTPGTSFTIALPIAPIKNVVCVQFVIL